MAPPPKYMITRRLISRYFKNNLPSRPLGIKSYEGELLNCWKNNGLEDARCKEIEALH